MSEPDQRTMLEMGEDIMGVVHAYWKTQQEAKRISICSSITRMTFVSTGCRALFPTCLFCISTMDTFA